MRISVLGFDLAETSLSGVWTCNSANVEIICLMIGYTLLPIYSFTSWHYAINDAGGGCSYLAVGSYELCIFDADDRFMCKKSPRIAISSRSELIVLLKHNEFNNNSNKPSVTPKHNEFNTKNFKGWNQKYDILDLPLYEAR